MWRLSIILFHTMNHFFPTQSVNYPSFLHAVLGCLYETQFPLYLWQCECFILYNLLKWFFFFFCAHLALFLILSLWIILSFHDVFLTHYCRSSCTWQICRTLICFKHLSDDSIVFSLTMSILSVHDTTCWLPSVLVWDPLESSIS